jgi:hypothetical protein
MTPADQIRILREALETALDFAELANCGPFGGKIVCAGERCDADMEDAEPQHSPECDFVKMLATVRRALEATAPAPVPPPVPNAETREAQKTALQWLGPNCRCGAYVDLHGKWSRIVAADCPVHDPRTPSPKEGEE